MIRKLAGQWQALFENLVGPQSHSCVYVLSVAAFVPWCPSWVVVTETAWPTESKILTICSSTENSLLAPGLESICLQFSLKMFDSNKKAQVCICDCVCTCGYASMDGEREKQRAWNWGKILIIGKGRWIILIYEYSCHFSLHFSPSLNFF